MILTLFKEDKDILSNISEVSDVSFTVYSDSVYETFLSNYTTKSIEDKTMVMKINDISYHIFNNIFSFVYNEGVNKVFNRLNGKSLKDISVDISSNVLLDEYMMVTANKSGKIPHQIESYRIYGKNTKNPMVIVYETKKEARRNTNIKAFKNGFYASKFSSYALAKENDDLDISLKRSVKKGLINKKFKDFIEKTKNKEI